MTRIGLGRVRSAFRSTFRSTWLGTVALRSRSFVQAPALARIEEMDASLNSGLDRLARRLDDLDSLIQTFEARVATVAERSTSQVESQARLARRVAEIEKLLAVDQAPPRVAGET